MRVLDLLRRPVVAVAAVLVVYAFLSMLMDGRGYLGTDTGAKVATLEVMAQRGTTDPDIGYWAERFDPQGRVHPLYQATETDDGGWVAVTTLPILELARPLYDWAGYRATLILPMLGSLACALAARGLSRRVAGGDGWAAFWLVALASPMALYALDFWEHSLGVAAMVGGLVLLLDARDLRSGWWQPALAGALLGAAATLRNEALVYTVVMVGATCLSVAVRARDVRRATWIGGAAVLGFVPPWALNRALEVSLGGLSRTDRATGTAATVGTSLGDRGREALVTLIGVKGDGVGSIVIGAGVVLAVLLAARAERRGDPTFARVALVLAVIPVAAGATAGLSFIPGLAIASPVTMGVLLRRPARAAQPALTVAVVALPLVWAFQYLGGAGPQWGGRYTLTTSLVLAVVGLAGLVQRQPVVGRGLVAMSVAVTALGVLWLGVRSRSIADLFVELRAVEADVLISRDAFLIREGGAATVGQRWLSADSDVDYALAVEVAERSGASTAAIVYTEPAVPEGAAPRGWHETDRFATDLAGDPLLVVTYSLPG